MAWIRNQSILCWPSHRLTLILIFVWNYRRVWYQWVMKQIVASISSNLTKACTLWSRRLTIVMKSSINFFAWPRFHPFKDWFMHIYERRDASTSLRWQLHYSSWLWGTHRCVNSLFKNGKEKYILTEEGSINKFLGISISKLDDNWYELAQSFLIERIIEFIESECPTELNGKQTITPVGKPLLHKYLMGVSRKYGWNYRTAVGIIGCLPKNTRPEISIANHQFARFMNKPMRSHEQAIIQIARYLKITKETGVIFQPDPKLGLKCFVDADFAGCWSQADTDDPENFMYRIGAVSCKQRLPSARLRQNISLYLRPWEQLFLWRLWLRNWVIYSLFISTN